MPIPDEDDTSTTTVLNEWVSRVRAHLESPKQGPVNVLASPYVAGSGSMVFTQALGGLTVGSILSIGENTCLVIAANEGTKTVTIIGGWASSDDADAEAGSVARVNPQFTDHRIVQELNDALASLTSPDNGLYRVYTETVDYVGGTQGYDLDAPDLLRPLGARRQTSDLASSWPRLRAGEFEVIEDADTDDFPSGKALIVRCGEGGYRVRFYYAAAFDTLAGLTTRVATTGIPAAAEDIPPLTAAIALMAGREIPRNTMGSQGDTRRPGEVPQGAVGRSYGGLVAREQRRIGEEARRLRARFPMSR